MSQVHAASRTTAMAAGISGGLLTWVFHRNDGLSSLPIGVAFGTLAALVAYSLVYCLTRARLQDRRPVLGAARGASIGIATFAISVICHTAIFPGKGGFFTSLIPIMLIGLAMFGWCVAAIGACVGLLCERRYF